MSSLSRQQRIGVFCVLAVLMVATRYHHVGSLLHLPDTSTATFFLAGLLLARLGWFALFMGLAVAVDVAAVGLAGVSDYCVTPAYAFLLPAYGALWAGGRIARRGFRADAASLGRALALAALAWGVSYLLSNGSFYWLGGRVAETSWNGWLQNAWTWGPRFARSTLAYVAVGLVVTALALRLAARKPHLVQEL